MRPSRRSQIAAAAALLGAAAPATAAAQSKLPNTPPAPFGVDLDYGIALGGLSVYRSTFRPFAPGARARLRVALSPSGAAYLGLTTPSLAVTPGLTASLRASVALADPERLYDVASGVDGRSTSFDGAGVEQDRWVVEPTLTTTGSAWQLSFGPSFKRTSAHMDDLATARAPDEMPGYGQLGAKADLAMRLGALRVSVGGAAYPALLDVTAPFGEFHAQATSVSHLPLPFQPSLVVSAGFKKVLGPAPYHEAATLGGSRAMRAFARGRFAGDLAYHGGLEIRLPVAQVSVLGRTARIGVLGLGEAGGVRFGQEYSTGLLIDGGGGVWLRPAGSSRTFTAGVASGQDGARFFFRAELLR